MKRDRRGTLKETIQDLKTMEPKEKWNHIWTYYHLWIIGFVILILFSIEVGKIIVNAGIEVLQSGLVLNMELSEDLTAHLEEDYLTYLEADPKQQSAEVQSMYYGVSEDAEYGYYTQISIITKISAQEWDYLIADDSGIEGFLQNEIFLDLREFYTEEELSALGENVLYDTTEEGESYPVGIRLNDTEFGETYLGEQDYYLLFFANSERKENMTSLLSYLMQE